MLHTITPQSFIAKQYFSENNFASKFHNNYKQIESWMYYVYILYYKAHSFDGVDHTI